jgi:hypothetical protein
MPHSMPLRTSATTSLKRRSDSSSPSKMTTLLAQHADRLVALDLTLDDHAARDLAELGGTEHVADLGHADDLFAHFGPSRPVSACFTSIDDARK